MMIGQPILEVENVSFSYRQRHSFFRHSTFQALNNVSFMVERGETLGMIGKNGSGKSTLLRLLAGIFEENRGRITRRCNSISLLSLALGFDPELTGRENAIISGLFLGSSRRTVHENLDAVVEFSELGPFIDEPVKTYSSGMRARLGFSVAVRMHAELLLIDEVLSVGDEQFRKKAEQEMLGRIRSEQTVIIVSHALGQLKQLCDRLIWMETGKIRMTGAPEQVIDAYLDNMSDSGHPTVQAANA